MKPDSPTAQERHSAPNQSRHTPIVHYGLPDRLIQHGTREEMLADAGLTKEGLLEFIRRHAGGLVKVSTPKAVSAK